MQFYQTGVHVASGYGAADVERRSPPGPTGTLFFAFACLKDKRR